MYIFEWGGSMCVRGKVVGGGGGGKSVEHYQERGKEFLK